MGTIDQLPDSYTWVRQQQAQQNSSDPCDEAWIPLDGQGQPWSPHEAAYGGAESGGYPAPMASHGLPFQAPRAAQQQPYHTTQGFSGHCSAPTLLPAPQMGANRVPVNSSPGWHHQAPPMLAETPQPRHFTDAPGMYRDIGAQNSQPPAQYTAYETRKT